MKSFRLILLLLLFTIKAFSQKAPVDSTANKEGIAIAEIGGASSTDLKTGKSSFGYNLSVEATPIEEWLEVELGLSRTYAANHQETDIDFLFKKPWTLSSKLEFMLGVGPEWSHSADFAVPTNSWSGEIAADFMYWPFKKHQFGFYVEPDYVYGFGKAHEQSVEVSGGLLINIP